MQNFFPISLSSANNVNGKIFRELILGFKTKTKQHLLSPWQTQKSLLTSAEGGV